MRRLRIACFAVLMMSAWATPAVEVQAQNDRASLFARMGGERTLRAVVEDLVGHSTRDASIGYHFRDTNLERLRQKLYEHLCVLGAGPCTYTGDPMRETHEGHGIDDRDFARLVELLREVLDARGVGQREKNELLELLAPMKREIVERKR